MSLEGSTIADATENTSGQINRLYYVLLAGVILLTAFLLVFRLAEYPAPWYDEGSHLHVAENLAVNGVYADFSSEGNRAYGPAIGVGPTVMLPAALAFQIFGISIPVARALIVVYAVLALAALFALSTHLVNQRMALLALVLLVLAPGVEFIFNSRTVLGEIPGLFFVLAGFWVWFRSESRLPWLIGAGVLFGLAAITKNQYALVVLPTLLIGWIADMIWYRQYPWWHFVSVGVISGLMFFGWLAVVLFALGDAGSMSENLATLRVASSGAFFIFGLPEMERAARYLVDSGVYGGLLLPAILYVGFLALRRSKDGQQWGMLLIFVLINLFLFISSLAWPRYAFAGVAIGAIFVARMLYDLTGGLQFRWQQMRDFLNDSKAAAPIVAPRLVVLGLMIVLVVLPLYLQINSVVRQGSDDAYQMADYLNNNIATDALIETWEQELSVLTDHQYHYPPQVVLAYSVDEVWRNGTPANELYDFRDYVDPDYLVIGPFGKYTWLYPPEYLASYEMVTSIGAYDLYQRQS